MRHQIHQEEIILILVHEVVIYLQIMQVLVSQVQLIRAMLGLRLLITIPTMQGHREFTLMVVQQTVDQQQLARRLLTKEEIQAQRQGSRLTGTAVVLHQEVADLQVVIAQVQVEVAQVEAVAQVAVAHVEAAVDHHQAVAGEVAQEVQDNH